MLSGRRTRNSSSHALDSGRHLRLFRMFAPLAFIAVLVLGVCVSAGASDAFGRHKTHSSEPRKLGYPASQFASEPSVSASGKVVASTSTAPASVASTASVPAKAPAPAKTSGPAAVVAAQPGSTTKCPLPAYPDATCTGVPAGTALTNVSGDLTVTTAGSIVRAKNVSGCILVEAPGVTVTDSKATCIFTQNSARTSTPWLVIEDSEVNCNNVPGSSGIGDTNFRVYRTNIHGCENGFDADGNADIEDSYIHDLFQSVEAHTDGLQSAVGSNLTINHNRFYAETPGMCNGQANCGGTSAINVNNSPTGPHTTNLTITNNLLAGGAYTLYCPIPSSTNVQIVGNRFSKIFYPNGGNYGTASDCVNDNGTPREAVWSGNVWDATGLPI